MIRRMDPLALSAIAMLVPTGIWGLWEGGIQTAMLVLPVIGTPVLLVYLAGPAAFVAVTRTHVVVANPLVRYSVPRSLVDGVRIDGFSIELQISGHSPVPIAALTPGAGPPNRWSRVARLRRIATLLEYTPATLMAGTMVRRYRCVHLVLLAVDVLALVGMVIHLSAGTFTPA
ncbi:MULTISPECIES: hypothetical protein [unclassified Micromonospora]|uniref:PH domain-containing protein n=1 Tax=unclassified Micromonospora TaxID=2617518 RepID=UPI001C2476BE|nr:MULTISPECIES: hypothetical protein [unclassified Micromonospora]MBU8856588.1 hypothetical protein [Micromonospora sp. WMMB482]MDM4782201.1 hypothetical protein [Micromonospora sp. b486]